MLATGKRPYVLVDLYGEMNALPKLIDDKQVRTKDIRAFLERDFPAEVAAERRRGEGAGRQHRQAIEDFGKAQAQRRSRRCLERQARPSAAARSKTSRRQ